jgi:hypothetical protein
MPLGFVWVLERRAVLVHAPEFDVAALCRLRIGYDLVFNQPSLSTRIDPVMSGLGNEPHMLMLSIAPKAVDTCTVGSNICYSVTSARMINMLPCGVTGLAVVPTLTLYLNEFKSSLVLKDQSRTKGRPQSAAVARDDGNVARSHRPRTLERVKSAKAPRNTTRSGIRFRTSRFC